VLTVNQKKVSNSIRTGKIFVKCDIGEFQEKLSNHVNFNLDWTSMMTALHVSIFFM